MTRFFGKSRSVMALFITAVLLFSLLGGCATKNESTVKNLPARIESSYCDFLMTYYDEDYEYDSENENDDGVHGTTVRVLYLAAYDENDQLMWDYNSAPCEIGGDMTFDNVEYIGTFGGLVFINEQEIVHKLEGPYPTQPELDYHIRVLDAETGKYVCDNDVKGLIDIVHYYDKKTGILYISGDSCGCIAFDNTGKVLWKCIPDAETYWAESITLKEDRIIVHYLECGENYDKALADGSIDVEFSYDGKLLSEFNVVENADDFIDEE